MGFARRISFGGGAFVDARLQSCGGRLVVRGGLAISASFECDMAYPCGGKYRGMGMFMLVARIIM